MVEENIVFLLNQFLRCIVYENVVFCWVMHHQEIVDALLARLETENVRVVSVSLTVSPEALTARVQKDISAGLRTAGAVEKSLSYLPLYACMHTIKLDTTGLSAAQTAEKIAEIH